MRPAALAVALLVVASLAPAAAEEGAFASAALKAAEPAVAASIRRSGSQLKLRLVATRSVPMGLAELHDPQRSFFTGFEHANIPPDELGLVQVDAYALPEETFVWRMIFAVESSQGSSPTVFFSTGPFSGDCGDPMIGLRPRRLLNIDGRFLLELEEEDVYHACASRDATIRRNEHLFGVGSGYRELYRYEEMSFDGRESRTAILNPTGIGEKSGSGLLLTSASFTRNGKGRKKSIYLKWTQDGRLTSD